MRRLLSPSCTASPQSRWPVPPWLLPSGCNRQQVAISRGRLSTRCKTDNRHRRNCGVPGTDGACGGSYRCWGNGGDAVGHRLDLGHQPVTHSYRMTDMGGQSHHGGHPAPASGVSDFMTAQTDPANMQVELVAALDGERYALNGSSPGPVIRARLRRRSVPPACHARPAHRRPQSWCPRTAGISSVW